MKSIFSSGSSEKKSFACGLMLEHQRSSNVKYDITITE